MGRVKTERPIRVGLIGAGMIGQMRARAIAKLPADLRLVAVADPRRELAQKLAGGVAGVRVYDDGLALAADVDVDAVIISTPPAMHEKLGLACLRAGKAVLCEKPLADSVEACERLVKAADEAGVCLATGFTLRQTPAAQLARQLVDAGAIGDIDHVRGFHGHRGGSDFGPPWITDRAMTGGGTLMDNGIHLIDLARWFLGEIEEVTGMASNHSWHKDGCEDNGFVLMRNRRGQIASVQSSWTEWRGYRWRMELYGTEGAIRFGFPPMWLSHARGKPGETMKFKHHLFPRYQVLERLKGWEWSLIETLVLDLRDWVDAICTGQPPRASGRDGLEAVRIARSVSFR
jgi:predicted dehydrogenase